MGVPLVEHALLIRLPVVALRRRGPDVLSPRMVTRGWTEAGWTPGCSDDLYVSFTNATALRPTDTLPLTPWVKALLTAQSVASLLTTALAAARAVNLLS